LFSSWALSVHGWLVVTICAKEELGGPRREGERRRNCSWCIWGGEVLADFCCITWNSTRSFLAKRFRATQEKCPPRPSTTMPCTMNQLSTHKNTDQDSQHHMCCVHCAAASTDVALTLALELDEESSTTASVPVTSVVATGGGYHSAMNNASSQ
jgi:hypothetical protein